MSRRQARFSLKEMQTMIRAAQEAGTRLVFELEPDGKFRIVVNDTPEPVAPRHEVVL